MATKKPQLGPASTPLSDDGQTPLQQPPSPSRTNPLGPGRKLPQVPLPVRMRKTILDRPEKE
jgi:hypothetical protein